MPIINLELSHKSQYFITIIVCWNNQFQVPTGFYFFLIKKNEKPMWYIALLIEVISNAMLPLRVLTTKAPTAEMVYHYNLDLDQIQFIQI